MNRKVEIIKLLLEAKQPVTTIQISEKLNVSSRTIRSDLMDIEAKVLAHHLKLVKKPRVGISIEGSTQYKDQLCLDMIGEHRNKVEAYTKESRRNFILTKLLIGKNRLYTEYFTRTLYTSKSTIEKDLISIAKWLQQHHLNLERKDNQGLYISGKEMDIRNAFAIVVSAMEDHNETLEKIMSRYIHVDIEKMQKSLIKWTMTYGLSLSDANIKNLAFHIAIMVNRVKQKKTVPLMKLMERQIDELRGKEMILDLCKKIEKIADIIIPDVEIKYILLHLIGMSLDSNVKLVDEQMIHELKATAEEITDEFIANIEQIACLGLSKNLSLRESLNVHLLPTIYRLTYGLNLYNPLLHEIKENYASTYALASIINSSFEKKLGTSAGEEEIAFIALHVSMAIEKAKQKLTIAVVCPMGRGISRFLLIKLEENFPQINFLNYSLKDISNSAIPYVDMVIATVSIRIDKPFVTISAILSDDDIKLIKAMIRNFENKNKKFFSLQTILIMHKSIGKAEVLKELADRLSVCHYVEHSFLEGVLKRENMGSTEIGNGIVLTHGFHESVKRSQIAFCKLDEGIIWNTQEVKFIVMMAIDKHEAKNVMQMDWLYKTLNNDKVMQRIISSESEQEIYQLLIEEHDRY